MIDLNYGVKQAFQSTHSTYFIEELLKIGNANIAKSRK